jgi:hypothetical protein
MKIGRRKPKHLKKIYSSATLSITWLDLRSNPDWCGKLKTNCLSYGMVQVGKIVTTVTCSYKSFMKKCIKSQHRSLYLHISNLQWRWVSIWIKISPALFRTGQIIMAVVPTNFATF